MVMKIKAAIEAREDPDFIIIARTDANIYEDFESAIRRCKAYSKAGADVIFLEYVLSRSELERIPKEITNTPILVNTIESKDSEDITSRELEIMGYSIQIIPLSFIFSAYYAFNKTLEEFKKHEHSGSIIDEMFDIQSFNKIMGIDKTNELISKYEIGGKICKGCLECLWDIYKGDKENGKVNIYSDDLNKELINKISEEIIKKLNNRSA